MQFKTPFGGWILNEILHGETRDLDAFGERTRTSNAGSHDDRGWTFAEQEILVLSTWTEPAGLRRQMPEKVNSTLSRIPLGTPSIC